MHGSAFSSLPSVLLKIFIIIEAVCVHVYVAVMRTTLEWLIFSVGSGIEHGHQARVASTSTCQAISLVMKLLCLSVFLI